MGQPDHSSLRANAPLKREPQQIRSTISTGYGRDHCLITSFSSRCVFVQLPLIAAYLHPTMQFVHFPFQLPANAPQRSSMGTVADSLGSGAKLDDLMQLSNHKFLKQITHNHKTELLGSWILRFHFCFCRLVWVLFVARKVSHLSCKGEHLRPAHCQALQLP